MVDLQFSGTKQTFAINRIGRTGFYKLHILVPEVMMYNLFMYVGVHSEARTAELSA